MPLISEFFGIQIYMYWAEHFHAKYNEYSAIVGIKDGVILKGFLPARELKLILAWCEMYRDELMFNWKMSLEQKEMLKINPLHKKV